MGRLGRSGGSVFTSLSVFRSVSMRDDARSSWQRKMNASKHTQNPQMVADLALQVERALLALASDRLVHCSSSLFLEVQIKASLVAAILPPHMRIANSDATRVQGLRQGT